MTSTHHQLSGINFESLITADHFSRTRDLAHESGACGKKHFSTDSDVVLELHWNAGPDGIN